MKPITDSEAPESSSIQKEPQANDSQDSCSRVRVGWFSFMPLCAGPAIPSNPCYRDPLKSVMCIPCDTL